MWSKMSSQIDKQAKIDHSSIGTYIIQKMSSVILPPLIALKSTWFIPSFVQYSNEDSNPERHGFLKVNGDNIFSPSAKFEVVTANTGSSGLVHLRCYKNKKFLRQNASKWITPEADEPEEDQSKWSCTLFEPQAAADGNPDHVQFLHVQSKLHVHAIDTGGDRNLEIAINKPFHQSYFEIIDLESLVILPRHVAFKDNSGRYLKAEGMSLTFSNVEKGDPATWFEVVTDSQGWVKIKVYNSNDYLTILDSSNEQGRCAVVTPSLPEISTGLPETAISKIVPQRGTKEYTTMYQLLFWPVKFNATTVGLKSMLNNAFLSRSGIALVASSASLTADSRFNLEELVLSRKIYNAIYDFDSKVIYGDTPITMSSANATNNSSKDNTVEFKFKYTESQSSSWKVTKAWKLGIEFKASINVPFGLGSLETTYSGEYGETNEWEGNVTTGNEMETTYTAVVPANTSITVSLMATKGQTDVPYSYYQRDVLYNGKTIVYKKDDGMYQGIESKDFHFKVTVLKESSSRIARHVSTITQRLPDPSVDPTTVEMLPLPKPATEDAASSAVKP